MTSENLIGSSSHLLPASSHGAPDLMLWILWERNEPLWQRPYSWGSWVLTHPLPFPRGRNHGPRRSCLAVSVPPWGRGDAGLVKLFLLPGQCVQTHFFLLWWSAGASPLETWIAPGLSHPWVTGQVSVLQVPREAAGRGWSRSQVPAGSTAPMTWCAGGRDSTWVPRRMAPDPTAPTEVLLCVDGC